MTLPATSTAQDRFAIVEAGIARSVRIEGQPWRSGPGYMEARAPGNLLLSGKDIGPGDFHVTARVTLLKLGSTAASLVLDEDSHFGFDGSRGAMFVEGPLFRGAAKLLPDTAGMIQSGKPFCVEAARSGDTLTISVDGKELVRRKVRRDAFGSVGLRPWRSTMRVHEFAVTGRMVDPPPPTTAQDLPDDRQAALFVSGRCGYNTYRIPAVVVTLQGTVLAFCEGRRNSGSDTGDIDLVVRRCANGNQFGPQQVVWDDGSNTCGNPCPVVDRTTGTIWLLMTHNLGIDDEGQIVARTSKGTRTVWVSRSDDDGVSWSKPVEITGRPNGPPNASFTKRSEWTWYATGPGAGIQLRSGRMVIPCDHTEAGTRIMNSHVIYSDDHGVTWRLGGTAGPRTNECEAIELTDGRLLLNMRNYNREHTCRAVATSRDQGQTWSAVSYDEALVEPVCQASVRRYSLAATGSKDRVLFSNPANTRKRKQLTIRLSYDECRTWPVSRVLYSGASMYSSLAVQADGTILCLYERSAPATGSTVTLARFGLDWLEPKTK
jgi:sialidase-1